METSISTQTGTGSSIPVTTTGAKRLGRRAATLVAAAVVGVIAGIGVFGAPASAYSNQWVHHDLIPNKGGYEMAVYYDSYGRLTQVVADLNGNGHWDAWSAVQNGYPKGWLLDTVNEFDGQWDALVSATGQRWSNATGCVQTPTSNLIGGGYHSSGMQVRKIDSVYGLSWCYRSSQFSGVINAPIWGNMMLTLTRLGGLAPYSYCYSYPTAVGCYGRNW